MSGGLKAREGKERGLGYTRNNYLLKRERERDEANYNKH